MGLSESRFFINYFVALLLILLLISVIMLTGVYLIRRREVGKQLARREIKRTAIILSVLIPFAFITAFFLASLLIGMSDQNTIETVFLYFVTFLILFLIAYSVYWWHKFDKIKKSELFQVPVKASNLILVIAIIWPILGTGRIILFFIGDNPVELLLGLTHIMLGPLFAITWLRPTWYITEEGISWPLVFIKWTSIKNQQWLPKSDMEVLLRLQIKRWWLPVKIPINQAIPIDYERPLKAIIQKYTNHETIQSLD